MKKISALLLLFIIICSSTCRMVDQYPIRFNRKLSLTTVLNQVHEAMKEGGPMDDIYEMLDDFEKSIKDEETKHRIVTERQRTSCHDEFVFRKREIEDGKSALAAARTQRNNCAETLSQAELDLNNNQKEQDQLKRDITFRTHARKNQNNLYLQKVKEHTEADQALNEALTSLDELFTGKSSFLELSKLSSKMLIHSINLKATSNYAPVLAVFAQLSNDKTFADSVYLEKIRDLINNLKQTILKSLELYNNDENKQTKMFDKFLHDSKRRLADLEKREEDLTNTVTDMSECVSRQNEIIIQAKNKVSRNKKLFIAAEHMCKTFEAEFKSASEARNNELTLINKIRDIVKKRYAQLSRYAVSRGLKSPKEWREYKNKYVYNSGANHQQKHDTLYNTMTEEEKREFYERWGVEWWDPTKVDDEDEPDDGSYNHTYDE